MTKTTCLPRMKLKEYLNGWISNELQSEIELHLRECSDCEQTIVQLESDPDTLLEVLHSPGGHSSSLQELSSLQGSKSLSLHGTTSALADETPDRTDVQGDPIVAYALERASRAFTESPSNVDATHRNAIDSPPKTIGPYTLLQPLGHGGMGAVYLAQHQQLGKQVAIKLLPERVFRNDPYAARFQREIRTAGKLSHPAIVNATDAGTSHGMHYLVMEHIDGYDLSRIARYVGPLPVPEACKVAQVVALGLSHAHAEGVVHRDIKPSNVMLSRTGLVKILDFGLAQTELWEEASAELTTVGQLMGTLDYMAPEQAEKANGVDYRADLYSLGAMLFRLLIGRAPLAAAPDLSPLAKLRLLATCDPPSLRVLRPDLPKPLIELVDRLLQRDPAHRPASAAHVAESLETLSEGADLQKLVREAESLAQVKVESPSNHHRNETPWMAFPEPATQERRNGGRIGMWVALGLLPFFLLGGIFITIETRKGQLVIESDVANVEVKLLQNGKEYESIQVIPGAQSTRLMAGKYEIRVDAASEQISIDRDQVELKQGATVVARIAYKDAKPTNGVSEVPTAVSKDTLVGDDLLYEGRTLEDWLRTLEKDRSANAINESLQALKALVTPGTRDRIGDRLLKILPELDGKLALGGTPAESSQPLDYKVGQILRQCYPSRTGSAWTKKLCEVLDASDDPFANRILSQWEFFRGANEPTLESSSFSSWALEKVLAPQGRSDLALPTAKILRAFILYTGYSLTPSAQEKIVDAIEQSKEVPEEFFLEWIPGRNDDIEWSSVWANRVQRHAVESLVKSTQPEADKLMSATMLRLLLQNKNRIQGLEAIQDAPSIAARAIAELSKLANNPEELVRTHKAEDGYIRELQPVLESESSGIEQPNLGITYGLSISSDVRGNLALEYLRLLRVLPVEKKQRYQEAVEKIVRACQPNVIELMLALETNPYGFSNFPQSTPPRTLTLSWPSLSVHSGFGMAVPKNPGTPSMWMSYFLFQEAFVDLVAVDPKQATLLDDLKRQWAEQMVQRFDDDRNGTTSLEEAEIGIRARIWRGYGKNNSSYDPISSFDLNGDGVFQGGELHECLTKLRKDVARETGSGSSSSEFMQKLRTPSRPNQR